MMVRIVLKTLLNRLARSQPMTPVEMTRGAAPPAGSRGRCRYSSCRYRSTSATSGLYRFINNEIDRLIANRPP